MRSSSVVDAVSIGRTRRKVYSMKCPDGEVIEVRNLRQFCRKNKVRETSLRYYSFKLHKPFNGWQVIRTKVDKALTTRQRKTTEAKIAAIRAETREALLTFSQICDVNLLGDDYD